MLAFAAIMSPDLREKQDTIIETYLKRIAAGDREALALLYEEIHASVYGFALSILKNKYDAEDVVHDAFLRVWTAAESYKAEGKPLAWIYTITRNLANMRLREQSRVVAMAPGDWHTMFADIPTVDSTDRLVLEALLRSLSDEERQIVMLHSMSGLKHREIAAISDLRLSTVLSKYNRALRKLRNILKEAE